MPESREQIYLARLFVDSQAGGEFNPDEDKILFQSSKDRRHKSLLVKPKTGSGMALQTNVSDFVEELNLSPYVNEVRLRAQLVERKGNREEVLGDADERADKEIVLYLDGERPTLTAQGPNRGVEVSEKFPVEVLPRDEVTEIDKVEFALKVQRNPESTDPDERMLVDPQPVPRRANGDYQLMHAFETPGDHQLWFQATDKSGNKSQPESVIITVNKPLPAAQGGQPAAPKFGSIAGRAVLRDGARGNITTVELKDASGRLIDERAPSPDGNFTFEKVRPGEYTLEAQGTVAGNFGKPVPKKVTVEGGKSIRSITVQLQ
jgi:hypothetical protein